jgi:predicted O-linked N-acetylglucosamine transferase (SPINDLY family)
LSVAPNHAGAWNYLGVLALQAGQPELALNLMQKSVDLERRDPSAWNNLGEAYRALGRFHEATEMYRRALEISPAHEESHMNLANALKDLGRLEEAAALFRQILVEKPASAMGHFNLGNTLAGLGRGDEAIAEYRRAIELQSGYFEAQNNLGGALKNQGRLAEALEAYRRARETRPGHPGIHSNIIYFLQYLPGDNAAAVRQEQRLWNQRFAEPAKGSLRAHRNARDWPRRLRIGYVSPEFRDHVTGRYLRPLFKAHDHRNFAILCYSGATRPDAVTAEFEKLADGWRTTAGIPDDALAEMIRGDEVDILVDLTQHLAGNRLPVFARQPAPVQVSFAGYPESTGLDTIEYRISDRWLETDAERRVGEHVFFVDSFWCYDPCGMEVAVNELPAKRNGHVTFGSLNNFCKINDDVLRLWARVLAEMKDSRLLLLSVPGSHRQRTLDFLASHGAEPGQVEFVAPGPRKEYLELYHRVDIALDPFPVGGHTTSLDALWMGVPVVSLAGQSSVSRAGLSILNNLGLPELVAFAEDDYVRIAAGLAADGPRLAGLRNTLRQRLENSVLMDALHFAQQIEAAYGAMWSEWCARPPRA